MTPYFPTILGAIFVAFLLTPLAISIARRFKLIDVPRETGHKKHNSPTPMAGGMVIAFSLTLIGSWLHWYSSPIVLGILGGAGVIFVFGLLDDLIGFGAIQKLTGQTLALAILILTGTRVHLFENEVINFILTFFWVVGLVNAYNFVDSMDGLALGLAGIASAFFMLVTIESGQVAFASLAAGLSGVCVGMFFHNMTPAKTFLGDSGAQLLGFLLAAIGVAYSPPSLPKLSSWYVPIMVVGVPIFDMTLVVFSRFRRKAKIYKAAMDHTYHRLRALGLETTRAVFSMHLMAVVLGLAAFIALNAGVIIGNTIFAGAVLSGIALIVIFEVRYPGQAGES